MSGLGEERCGGQSRRPCAVAMATVVQDEARWLPEWLEYHLALGFGHFYLYDDGSADELDATLAPYLEEGVATLHRVAELGPLPTTRRVYSAPRNCTPLAGEMPMWRDERGWCITRLHFPQQVAVVRHALEAYGGCSSWMAFFDVDEFLLKADDLWLEDFFDSMSKRYGKRPWDASDVRDGKQFAWLTEHAAYAADRRLVDDSLELATCGD